MYIPNRNMYDFIRMPTGTMTGQVIFCQILLFTSYNGFTFFLSSYCIYFFHAITLLDNFILFS